DRHPLPPAEGKDDLWGYDDGDVLDTGRLENGAEGLRIHPCRLMPGRASPHPTDPGSSMVGACLCAHRRRAGRREPWRLVVSQLALRALVGRRIAWIIATGQLAPFFALASVQGRSRRSVVCWGLATGL